MSKYKANAKTPDRCKHKPLRLSVSLNNPGTTHEKLSAALEWADKRFDLGMIVLCDTLNVHNYKLWTNGDREEAYQMAYGAGNKWIADNKEILDRYKNKFRLIRWDSCISATSFAFALQKIRQLLRDNKIFQKAVYEDICKFLHRNAEVVKEFGEDKVRAACIEYLLEELAADAVMYRHYAPVVAYPGKQLKSQYFLSTAEDIHPALHGYRNSPRTCLNFHKKSEEGGENFRKNRNGNQSRRAA